jgi:nitroreductase
MGATPGDIMPGDIRAYHQRTRHAPHRYALGPAFLDWDSQPNPFRSFEGARRIALPLRLDAPTPPFADLDRVAPAPLDHESAGLFLELALGLSAWKELDGTRWALRNNPSSGNLHPTEGWVLLPALPGIGALPALYHYAPLDHALEERRVLDPGYVLPPGSFLLAFSSVPWREAWKYGERSFRYCQHDAGHALAAAAYAGACLGWWVRLLASVSDSQLSALLGLDRPDAVHRFEGEHPDMLALVSPDLAAIAPALPGADDGEWYGRANRLSEDHDPWPAVDRALRLTVKPETAEPPPFRLSAPRLPLEDASAVKPAGAVIRLRRSAQRMDGTTGLGRATFFRMLARTLPDATQVPWGAFPWPPRLALFLFVHRVEGVAQGLYALVRDPDSLPHLRLACDPEFAWQPLEGCPLPLFLLREGDEQRLASRLSCLQAIAGKGAFSLGMVADFARALDEDGPWAYRRLHWEAGVIGQVLYLEATAARLSGTGIGCFFDADVLKVLGIADTDFTWASLYHFTVGAAVEDTRLSTLPAYGHLQR